MRTIAVVGKGSGNRIDKIKGYVGDKCNAEEKTHEDKRPFPREVRLGQKKNGGVRDMGKRHCGLSFQDSLGRRRRKGGAETRRNSVYFYENKAQKKEHPIGR